MQLNKNTKISILIKENEATIEAIASINKHFLKLKNPILRRVLAPRVTVADAAKVGGVEVEVMIKKLEEIGFKFDAIQKSKKDTKNIKNMPDSNEVKNIVSLDVRPTLDSGEDPFNIIMKAVKELKIEETLQIINTFEPIPLIRKLESKGYESWTERPTEGVVHTFFKLNATKKANDEIKKVVKNNTTSFDEKRTFFGNKIKIIDVRHLEMPEPMVTILKEIEILKEDHALYVDHKKIPQFLLPELENRNFDILYKEIDSSHTILLIYKSNKI